MELEKTELPSWLLNKDVYPLSSEKIGRQHHYVDNTLNRIAELMERSIFSEKYALKNGLLQRIDPRLKVFSFFSFIVAVSLFQNIHAILVVYAIVLCLCALSHVSLKFFLKRVWVFVPLFAGIIALPAIFNIFTPGKALITIVRFEEVQRFWSFEYSEISITQEGIFSALLFTFRVATSVSLVILLTLTTRWVEILKALRVLGVPQIFILVLSMTYQYIILLARLIQEMYMAKKARTIPQWKTRGRNKVEQRWVASRIGFTFQKSNFLIQEVHNAMIARGFRGEIQLLQPFKFHRIDYSWIFGIFAILLGVVWINFL